MAKEKFCARIEITFFPLVFTEIPNTRLEMYILVHFWHLLSIIVTKNIAGDIIMCLIKIKKHYVKQTKVV